MDKRQSPIYVLNLSGELIPELAAYFSSRKIVVVNPLQSDDIYDWSHIITKDLHDFSFLNKTYDITTKDRHIISMSQVTDLQNFTINNGNLIMDDIWLTGPMGQFILDKYFQNYGGISITDNYPAFTEIGSFNIANPFNTGEYLDRMVQKAFDCGVNALSVKTFFDHLIMYATGLKARGKAGLPFEVTYGVFEEIFGVQLHFYSNQLSVIDVAASLSSSFSKKPEEYYLNVAVQASDFFDFSYMPQVNKVVVTSLWSQNERIKFENRGLMFASLLGGLPLAQYKNEGATSTLVTSEEEIADFSEKVSIPGDLTDETSESLVRGFTEDGQKPTLVKSADLPPEEFKKVKSSADDEEEKSRVVKGSSDDDDFSSVVSGGEPTRDEAQLIKGGSLLEELAQTVKGKFEEDKHVVKISGDKFDVEKVAFTIASKIDETTKEKDLKVRSLGASLPQSLKTGLFDFAKGLNKSVDDLNDDDIDRFQIQKVPDILKKELLSLTSKQKGNGGITDAGAAQIKQLESKLAAANSDNEKLKGQLKTMSAEVRILKDARSKVVELQMKAKEVSGDLTIRADDDETLRKQFQQKLSDQKSLNELELKKLSQLLERESKLIAELKQEEMKGRKLQLESTQKEAFFSQEIEKAERLVKGKDLILIKTKESFTKLVEKKDKDISDLRSKLDQLSKAVASNASPNNAQTIRELEKQNQNLSKQIESYKNKITILSTNMQPTKSEESFKEELRKLQMTNQQMKNQLDMAKRENEKVQAKVALESNQLAQLRIEKSKLEEALKKAESHSKTSATPNANPMTDAELKRLQAQNQILDTQVKDSMQKITNLEAKLVEATKPVKTVQADENSKVRVTQLENSVKKLTQDLLDSKNQLAEAKKETNKLRQEKTALQNQLDKLKKEADKASKKPGGKAA